MPRLSHRGDTKHGEIRLILPFAIYKYVDRMNDGKREPYHAAIVHTNGGKSPIDGDLYHWWKYGAEAGVGAHLQVGWKGNVFQYLDTIRYTGHAWDANHWTVGIETEDDGDPSKPWTPAQVKSLVLILRTLRVPAVPLRCGRSEGVGFHQQFSGKDAPCSWNRRNHNCPGPVRRNQLGTVLNLLQESYSRGRDEAWLISMM